MKELINALLTDENGISEEAYHALLVTIESRLDLDAFERDKLMKLVKSADATDGRFYFGN